MPPVVVSIRPITSVMPFCVNHTPPSALSPTMSPGTFRRPVEYSVMSPAGVMRPMPGSRPCSVNQRLPSGPVVMSAGALATVRPVENSVTGVA